MDLEDKIKMKGELTIEIRDAKTGKLKSRDHYKNLIVTTGKNSIAKALAGIVTNKAGQITYFAVGTDNTAPVIGDTTLGTEIFRKQISIRSSNGKVASFQTFFNQNEGNGTLKEAGLFGEDASATTDSGQLFAHTLINRTKSASDTLTATWAVTIG